MSTSSTSEPRDHRRNDGDGSRGEAPGASAPLLDPSVLGEMERDFSDTDVVARFARDFSLSLDDRIDRLDRLVRDGDRPGASEAAVSLSTSADMIGAGRLGHVARTALDSLAGADADIHAGFFEGLRICASDTVRELELTYPPAA